MNFNDLFEILQKLAPAVVGNELFRLIQGDPINSITKIGVCVDPTAKNIAAAIRRGVQVLISYHPWQGEAESILAKAQLTIWPLHDNWDNAPEGTNQIFATAIGLSDLYLKGEILYGYTDTSFKELIEVCQRNLNQNILAYTGELKEKVRKVGIWAGPGYLPNYKKFWEACKAESCDTILSSELTLSALRFSQIQQLKLIDLGHSVMAKPGMIHLTELLRRQTGNSCTVDFFDDLYSGCYYTNCAFADQFTEAEDNFFKTE